MKTPTCDGYWWVRVIETRVVRSCLTIAFLRPNWNPTDCCVDCVGSDDIFRVDEFEWLEPIAPPAASTINTNELRAIKERYEKWGHCICQVYTEPGQQEYLDAVARDHAFLIAEVERLRGLTSPTTS